MLCASMISIIVTRNNTLWLGVSVVMLATSWLCFKISHTPPQHTPPPDPHSPDTPHPHTLQKTTPESISVAGGLISISGVVLFFIFGMNSFNVFTIAGLVLMAGGMLLILSGKILFGDKIARFNLKCKGAEVLSLFLMVGGMILGILVYVGAFDQKGGPGAVAAALLIAGAYGFYYGETRRKDEESLSIGKDMGFKTTATSGSEARYDSKGVMNGVEVLINLEQGEPSRGSPACFVLEILCRCRNTQGVRLEVTPKILPGISFGTVPLIPSVPYWDFYDIRCDQLLEALRLLPDARQGDNVFTDERGFSGMSLKGSEFKFVFNHEGYADTFYVQRVAEEVSRLASRLA